jgi:hypothetical protein
VEAVARGGDGAVVSGGLWLFGSPERTATQAQAILMVAQARRSIRAKAAIHQPDDILQSS